MGGIASARALAKFYAMLASGGCMEGKVFFKNETLEWMSTRLTQGFDPVLQREMSFSAGFMMDPLDGNGCKIRSLLGPSLSAFGHAGAGGSLGFADPKQCIGFGYVMNQMESGVLPHERCTSLVRAFYEG
jgi:CubicO group peptidase (beta-lactamase class C family)